MKIDVYIIRNNTELNSYLEKKRESGNDKLVAQVGNFLGVVGDVYAGPYENTFEFFTCGPMGIAKMDVDAFSNGIRLTNILTTRKGSSSWNAYKNKLPASMIN